MPETNNSPAPRSGSHDERRTNVNDEPRIRRSIEDLQHDYDKGNKKPLEDLMRAWKGSFPAQVSDVPCGGSGF